MPVRAVTDLFCCCVVVVRFALLTTLPERFDICFVVLRSRIVPDSGVLFTLMTRDDAVGCIDVFFCSGFGF